jgi:7,8-dihydroneopterin aldolase/epimerase/oxygenase
VLRRPAIAFRPAPAQKTGMDHKAYADITQATRRMFIRDLTLAASIGVHAHERGAAQRVCINVELAVLDDGAQNLSRPAVGADDLARVVDYEAIVNRISGLVQLVETLAERLAETCLLDARVRRVLVRVEKLDVFADAAAVGVEIERRNN